MLLVYICTFADMNLLEYASENHICTSGENIQESGLANAWDLACRNKLFLDLNCSWFPSHSFACPLQ